MPRYLFGDVSVDVFRWDGFDPSALRAFVGDERVLDVGSRGAVLDLGSGDVDTLPLGWSVVRVEDGLLMVVPPHMAHLIRPAVAPAA